ncbi:unnamed protein product [Rhizophagus irregularis]|uniref:Uncharacterized protein n=1 Tax=Rhizophagus irregularis TaxID=588596 RepID=A0A915YTJ7_9GLOM|nr:unnamed protein product [Rhizophagus irregularis]
MRSNYLKVFALFVIVLCVYPLRTIAQIKTFLHEEKDYGLESPPRVAKIKSYDDLVVVRIVRNDTSKSNAIEHCNYDILFLRMIYPDGTVIEKDIKLEDVQLFNYCSVNIDVDEDHLKYEIIENNKILVIYYNSTDDIKVEGWGMIIDFDGKVFDRTPIGVWGYKDFRRLYKLRVPLIQISLNIKKENGFIIGYKLLESNDFEWKQYKVELDGKLTILTNGKIKLDSRAILERNSLISTVDEGYSFIYKVNDTLPNSALKDLIIAELIGYNKTEIDKVYLYRVNLLDRIPQPISCNIEYVGVGHSCSLPMIYNESNYNLKIGFLSSGAIISLNITHIEFPNNEFRFRSWRLQSLIFGGYMLPEINRANNRLDIYVFAENGTLHDILSSEINLNYAYTMLPNNTLLVARMEYNNTWGFNVIDLPKLTIDNGYYNANIESTFPGINSSISSDITNISIDFYVRVTLSDGKLSIFQIIDQRKILRQTTSGRGCILDNDDKRVIVNILDSTFSKSGGNYSIKIDNNFIKSRTYGEPLLGIRENIWNFTIEDKKHLYTITSSTSGLLRLTVDGTNIIKNSSNVEQNQFFNALLDELADTVQISRGRLSKNSKNQIDPKSNDGRFLININIYESKNPYEKDVNSVIQDINYMMSYHDQSPIENGKLTYLDFTYGFIPAPNYLQEYGPKLLGLLLIIILLVIFYFLANKRERKGHNIVIFKFSLYIFDFVFDTLFIINNANDVKRLYIPSLIFYTVPIGLNMASTFFIMAKENTRNEFLSWFTENSKLASIFTILAGIDIEILSILHSNLAGFGYFQAPFSDSAKTIISWIAFINIFIEDIPQFIIQILFKMRSLTYDIIPIIALISSAITLNFSIISRSHQSINYIRNKRSTRRVSILELDDIE